MPKEAYAAIILAVPLLGTILGSSLVYFVKKSIHPGFEKILLGFAGGVMIAASLFSLLIPSIETSSSYGNLSWFPPLIGFLLGVAMMLGLDYLLPHLHQHASEPEGVRSKASRSVLIATAVSLHNFPEGLAAGVSLLGALSNNPSLSMMGALALALGIALQNFPEGAVVSIPMRLEGTNKHKAFAIGVFSGIVELLSALLAFAFYEVAEVMLPYLLSFAAGAMVYITVEELIPEANKGDEHSNLPTLSFCFGFALLLVLELALG